MPAPPRHPSAAERGPDDAIFVTGRLGEAEYGLRLLQTHSSAGSTLRSPFAKAALSGASFGGWILASKTSARYVDDGLVRRSIEATYRGFATPVRSAPAFSLLFCRNYPRLKRTARATFNVTELALHGGDDYELLFTVDKTNVSRIPRVIDRIPITLIGAITAGSKILVTDISGRVASLENRGWDPFR